jgi:hypothetical protein
VENRKQLNTITSHPKNNTKFFFGKPFWEKTQLEGEASLLSFLWYGNNSNTKEKKLSIELIETCGILGFYRKLTPSTILYNFPLLVVFLQYGIKYNNIEWNTFSS